MFPQKTYNYVKLYEYEMMSTKHQILHSLRMFFMSSQAFAQTFIALQTQHKETSWRRVGLLLRLDALFFWLLPENY